MNMISGQQPRCFIITDVVLVDDRARSEQVENAYAKF